MKKYLWMGILLMAAPCFSQEEKKAPVKVTLEDFEEPASWDVSCEIFSLTLSEAAKLKRAQKSDAEDYADLVKRVDSGKAALEDFLMIRAIERSNTVLEEVSEMIYATEFEPPELPNQVDGRLENIEVTNKLVSPATPTSFDTRKLGSIMEVELETIEKDLIYLGSSLTLANYLGKRTWGQEMSEVEMPKIAVQKIDTALNLKPNSPTLIGSISPPAALQPKEGEKVVWLAYVTVSKSKD